MFLICAIVWTTFGSSEVQWWNTYWQHEGNQEYYNPVYDKIREDEMPDKDFDVY